MHCFAAKLPSPLLGLVEYTQGLYNAWMQVQKGMFFPMICSQWIREATQNRTNTYTSFDELECSLVLSDLEQFHCPLLVGSETHNFPDDIADKLHALVKMLKEEKPHYIYTHRKTRKNPLLTPFLRLGLFFKTFLVTLWPLAKPTAISIDRAMAE